ncbi:MAG: tyrosine-type recombinase/integrase [Gemmatimonadota bacterium]|nr:tyrosine-type recombinase/integrase [Gemmatimonadota bacterium]
MKPTKAARPVHAAARSQPTDLKESHVEAVVAAAVESHSPATRRAYKTAWRQFAEWCREEGYEALPADPQTVAAYLARRADLGVTFSTLNVDRAGIRYHHETRGVDSPTQSAGVKRVLRGLRRRAAASKLIQGRGQVTGLSRTHLAAIRATAHQRRTYRNDTRESEARAQRRGDVDIALISVMRDALLRRSEAISLTWKDIEFSSDGSALVTIPRSKTDQEGAGAVQYIGRDAADALKAIRPDADESMASRPVFGLKTGEAVAKRIRAAAAAAGLNGRFRGHSPRIGMSQDLAEAGASTTDLMIVGRWSAHRMPAVYTRGQQARRGAVARYYQAG